jgi:hypothetical protein
MRTAKKTAILSEEKTGRIGQLQVKNEFKLLFQGKYHTYEVLGRLPNDVTDMTVMLVIYDDQNLKRHRRKVNLFNHISLADLCEALSVDLDSDPANLEQDLAELTNLLEDFRDNDYNPVTSTEEITRHGNPKISKQALGILNDKDLFLHLDKLLGEIGIVGEEKARMALFVIATTYKTKFPLHAIIQGTTGSGKSHLINTVASCIPPQDLLSLSRVTAKSLFHYQSAQLQNKLLVIQDFDGLEGSAQYALRELQSAQRISTSSTHKDRFGNLAPSMKIFEASFASLMSTTRTEIYADNMSRSILMGVDESEEQTHRILLHQGKLFAGVASTEKQEECRMLLRSFVDLLLPLRVINPFAEHLIIPVKSSAGRRLCQQFTILVNQVTFLRQFQRERDPEGRLIATRQDNIDAIDLFADLLLVKTDPLDPSTRQFYETLRVYLANRTDSSGRHFSTRELRLSLPFGKTQIFRYLATLKSHEMINVTSGSANRGFVYTMTDRSTPDDTLAKLKARLLEQVESVATK